MNDHATDLGMASVGGPGARIAEGATRRRATVAQGWATPIPAGARSAPILAHGSLRVRFYAPRGVDPQTPHSQDELYVVVQGNGWFVNGDDRRPFAAGDVLFVPAGGVHRFEGFTDDFCTWVMFYGPAGGERPGDAGDAGRAARPGAAGHTTAEGDSVGRGRDAAANTTGGILIRPAEARDGAAWAEMWGAYAAFYEVSLSDEVTAATWARILDPTSPIEALLATDAHGGALGFANYVLHPYTWSDKPACYLEDLFVRPEARGRGAGRALIERLIARGGEQGWGRLYWMTREDNTAARHLYDHVGTADGFVRYTIPLDNAHLIGGDA